MVREPCVHTACTSTRSKMWLTYPSIISWSTTRPKTQPTRSVNVSSFTHTKKDTKHHIFLQNLWAITAFHQHSRLNVSLIVTLTMCLFWIKKSYRISSIDGTRWNRKWAGCMDGMQRIQISNEVLGCLWKAFISHRKWDHSMGTNYWRTISNVKSIKWLTSSGCTVSVKYTQASIMTCHFPVKRSKT